MKHLALAILSAAALAGQAQAQQPAAPQLQGGVDLPVDILIVNNTPYSLFTETLGAGRNCMGQVIPATSIPGWREGGFRMVASATGSCFFKTSTGQQTFVLGVDGAEHRMNVPFVFSRDPNKLSVGQSGDGKFMIDIANVDVDTTGPAITKIGYTWIVRCMGPECNAPPS